MPEVYWDGSDSPISERAQLFLQAEDGEIYCPEGSEDLEAYENLKRGRCMLCGNKLGDDTVMVVSSAGILGVWDDGECLTDTNTFGFLNELEDSLRQKVERKAAASDGD